MSLGFQDTKKAVFLTLNANRVPAITGTAGIGKTQMARLVANEMDMRARENGGTNLFVPITCSLLQEGDLLLPIPQQQKSELTAKFMLQIVEILALSTQGQSDVALNKLSTLQSELTPIMDITGLNAVIRAVDEDIKKIIEHLEANPNNTALLFLDELNRASVPVQAELMNLVLARELKGIKLDERCSIVIAMNPPQEMEGFEETNYAVNSGDSAIMDRMVFIAMKPNFQDWKHWGFEINPITNEQNIDMSVLEFLDGLPNVEDVFNQKENEGSITATPRSWETVSELLKSYRSMFGDISSAMAIAKEVFNGSVGSTNATNFVSFLQNPEQHISISSIFNNEPELDVAILERFENASEVRRNSLFRSLLQKANVDLELINKEAQLGNDISSDERFEYMNHNYVEKLLVLVNDLQTSSPDILRAILKTSTNNQPLIFDKLSEFQQFITITVNMEIESRL